MPQRPQPSRSLRDDYLGRIHHHHNLYVHSVAREHHHPDDDHDPIKGHDDDWTDAFYGPACYHDLDDGHTINDVAALDLADAEFFLAGAGLSVDDQGANDHGNRELGEHGPEPFTIPDDSAGPDDHGAG